MNRPRAQLLALACVGVLALAGAAFVACLPGYTFGTGEPADGGADTTSGIDSASSSDGSGASDGPFETTTEGGAGPDGGVDGSFDAARPDAMTTVAVVNTGSKQYAAGYGYQIHVIYAQTSGRYWIFYADDSAGVIETAWSSDFVTWTGAEPITLTPGYSIADGSSFSVAYTHASNIDVVHIVENSVGDEYESFHIRATISGTTISASAPVGLPETDSNGDAGQGSSGPSCPNDGPSITIGANGRVWDVTAWTGHDGNTTCDTNIYESAGLETGAGWDGGGLVHDGYYVSLPDIDFAHALVDLPEAGLEMIVYPDYDSNENFAQNFDSIGWALSTSFSGGGPGTSGVDEPASSELFDGAGLQASLNDWSVCRLTDTDVHVMRHELTTTDGGTAVDEFDEETFNGASWSTLAPPPSVAGTTNTGLVLLSDANPADGMLAAVIGDDNAIHVAKWTSASGWKTLTSIPSDGNARQGLTGTGCGTSRPALLWTDGAGNPNRIVLADLSGLLGP